MTKRILFDCFILFSIFLFPWWLAVLVGASGIFIFSSFYEIMFLGIIIDSLYNAPAADLYQLKFAVTLITVFLFFVIEPLKKHLRLKV